MTRINHKNHYNVKFLKGYGHSIKVKDSKIILTNNSDPFLKPEIESWYADNMPYEKIVLSGKGYISTEALSLLSQNNRNVILLDTFGKPTTYLNPARESLTATNYRMAQYDTFRDESKREYLARQIILAKKKSQLQLLAKIGSLMDTLPDKEAAASRVYFAEYAKFIPKKFEFRFRNQSYNNGLKSNAKDVINTMLNYGYAVLAGEISKFVNGIGLDAYYGFLHKTHGGFQSLVYDIIEPFRWMVDYAVYSLANNQNSRQRIYLKDYSHTKDGYVILDYSLIKRFLERLERVFTKERPYRIKHGRKRSDGLSMCQEITIVKTTVQDLADYCLGRSQSFLASNR